MTEKPTSPIRVAAVSVDEVRFHSHNIRRNLGDHRSLADSIRRFGVMQPIVVEKYGDQLRLRAGHRRLAAAKLAGLTRIPAVIHADPLDDDEWIIASVQENVMRRGIDEAERTRAAQALIDLGCTMTGVGDAFGVSASSVRNWLNPTAKIKSNSHRANVKASTVRSFVAAWSAELNRREVTSAEILQALQQFGETARLEGCVPAVEVAA